MEKFSPAKGVVFPPSPSLKRNKNEEEHPSERLGVPCAMHNGCVGCVVTGRPGRSRQRPVFGSGSDCRDSYGGTALVRRDSSTSSHRERKELIKARVEAMREKLPKDSSSEDEGLPGGSEGSWEWRGKKVPPGIPPGGVGSAGSSPYLGRRSRFVGRTERFHQRRFSREFRDEGEEEEMWRRRANGLPPQGCVPWRASQSDVEAPYIGGRMAAANSGTTELGGSTMSYSPAQSPLQSPVLSGRRSASSTTSPGYPRDPSGLPYHGGNRAVPRRYPSTPLSQQSPLVEGPMEGRYAPAHSAPYYPMRSRSTDVLLSWRPEDSSYHGGEATPHHYLVKQPPTQRPAQEPQFHQRWPLANSGRSPPPPPPPRDPQRRITNPQSLSHFQMREQVPPNDGYVRRHYSQQSPYNQVQQENPYMNVQSIRAQPVQGTTHQQGVTCVADSQPRSRRPLRVTAGAYSGKSGDMSYMSDSQVGPNVASVRRTMTQHPPLESHYAIPFLADSPPPRCVINRVIREPQLAESVVHNPRPLMRQQRAPVFSRSRSSSPAPTNVNNRPALLPLRPFESSNDSHHFSPRGHSSAPQTPIDGPINRPLSIVSEEKVELPAKVPPVPPARSSSRRSSVSSLEAMEYGMWGMDRNSRLPNSKGPSGLEDALTELENIYKSLKLEDDVDGETDSVLMGSSETGATYDDQDRPLTDDMAYRRLHSKEKEKGAQQSVGGVVAQAGSYLLVSPTLGPSEPWTEPPPNSVNPGEPDVTLDDVVFRSIRQANAHMPADPQPPFGIPIGPVTRAPDSDYLHAKPPSPSPSANRTSSSARKTPDLVKDDLAFRSLRKDRQMNGTPVRPVPLRGVVSPPPRPSSSFSCVSSPPPLPNTGIDFQAIRKKRAVRSLSANLLGILQNTSLTTRPLSPPPATKAPLPPPSPTSPRKELRNLAFSPPPARGLSSPPLRRKALSPPVLASEDSETCANEIPALGNDATSSDTLTDGHADESNTKNKPEVVDERKEEPAPPVIKDSPGEVYEALGRVLSRVGKDMSSPGKKVKSKGDDDDLETLLVALAREARTTSENLGRELDQLRTSTVSPLSPSKVSGEMDKLPNVSAPSAEDPMKAGGADVTAKKDSDKKSVVSTESAKVPIKSGSMGFVVKKESGEAVDPSPKDLKKSPPEEVKAKEKTVEETKIMKGRSTAPIGFASAVMKQNDQAKPHVSVSQKEHVKTIISQMKSEENQLIAAPKPVVGQSLPFVFGKESDPSMNPEVAPIKASMKLVVRRNAEDLPKISIPPPVVPRKVVPISHEGSDATANAKEMPTQFVVASTQTNGSKSQNDFSEKDPSVVHEREVLPDKTREQNSESMSPGTVVEAIKKEFDQIFAIPAKKPRRSDEQERPDVNLSPVTKSRSLERPKLNVSVEQSKKAPPMSIAIVKEAQPSFEKVLKVKGLVKEPDVTCAYEKEFDELWKASNAAKKADELLDSELEKELDQLCSVKDTKEPIVVLATDTVLPNGSSGAQGSEAEGEVCSSASSGRPEDSEKTAACSLKPAVASPACLSLGVYRPQTITANASLDPTVISSMVSGLYPEDGDPLFTALAAILALVSFIAALLVRP
ncbi:hypothetical protein J437_LFUL014341 [Ladona fulva]|uniref:Uncharacterized protein n=1 Tax=Ladona fulva TaxID=123851 RepID=A0A8K0NZH5_LADFU|nr:hypothetical protein J437_LFUL014341 [Ladona fulva]